MGSPGYAAAVATAARSRDLVWEGCFNVRDLGGLRTRDGRETRFGAVVRSDNPGRLTRGGVDALRAHGVRTVLDLRDPNELADGRPLLEPSAFEYANVPVFDFDDEEFWEGWRGVYDTPRFYGAALEHWSERFADAVVAVARAPEGGVLVHCEAGRDRTGLVCALLLGVAEVPADAIAADYAFSAERLRPLYDEWLRAADDPRERARLERENVSEATAMRAVLDDVDAERFLLDAGATPPDLARVRGRLVG